MNEKLFRITSAVLLCLAIIHQLWSSHCESGVTIDTALQTCGAISIRDGEGYAERFARSTNLIQAYYPWQVRWPPGYSLLMAGGLAFTDDYVKADECLKAFSIITLFFAYYRLLTNYPVLGTRRAILFLLLLWAVGQPPFELRGTAELLALSCYTWAVYFTMGLANKNGRSLTIRTICCSTLLLGAATFRYAYWPLSIVCPIALCAWGCRFGRKYWVAGLVSCLLIVLGISSLSVLNKIKSGHSNMLAAKSQGIAGTIWWSNLLLMDPDFAQVPIVHPRLWQQMKDSPLEPLVLPVRWLTSLAILLCFIFTAAIWLRSTFFLAPQSPDPDPEPSVQIFWILGALTVILTLSMLAGLSILEPPEVVNFLPPPRTQWAAVSELRYYAPTWIFFLCAIVAASFKWKPRTGTGTIVQYFIQVILVLLFLLSAKEKRATFNWQWSSGWNPKGLEIEEQAVVDTINHLKQGKIPVISVSNTRSLGDLLTGAYRLTDGPSNGPILFETSAPVAILFEAWKPGSNNLSTNGVAPDGQKCTAPSYEQVIEAAKTCDATPVWSSQNLSLWTVERWGPAKLVR